ncbi:MAG TPA: hypothetical protein VK763_14430 [Terriglobales bacterium]|jgi:hypothetical protein|nr:hypothetical protein [Terriglobales bacterium]
MSAFHQMGNDSENLLAEPELGRYQGCVLSPVNYDEAKIAAQLGQLRERPGFRTVFDPQLYMPRSNQGCLRDWAYFPKDVETADINSASWWDGLNDAIAKTVAKLNPTAVCSPAVIPKTFPDEYFAQLVRSAAVLRKKLSGTAVATMQTVVASLADLATPGRAMKIASIMSGADTDECFLVFIGDTEPRRELADPEELKGAMKLISALEAAGQRVLVGFCSSELLLWKAAGATSCATGKFFNLRRFTLSRFMEPSGGGGQLPYFFEEALLAFLRQSDLLRIQQRGMLSAASNANPFTKPIFEFIPQGKAWVALGWRQFLYWFADVEERLRAGAATAEDLVLQADANWGLVQQKPEVIMEERPNDGQWVRQWRRALVEFPDFK